MTLKFWLGSVLIYNFNSVPIWIIGISLFSYRPSLRFQAQVPSTVYVVCVCESSIQTYVNGAFWHTFKCNFILKFEFEDLERSRSTGEDLDIVLCGYSVYHEDELRWQVNVVITFKISALVYWSDLKNLIGVDLSAWTAAFAPSLLSDQPQVSISLGPPH
jgi:hypothetical protein